MSIMPACGAPRPGPNPGARAFRPPSRVARRPLLAAALAAILVPARPHAAPRPLRLLALGDSLTAGFGLPHAEGFEARLQAALRGAGHDVTVLDGGVSGDTTAGALARLDWALGEDPDCVLVELGGNDGLRGIDPADTRRNLDSILDALAARHLPTLLSGMEAPPNLGKPYGDGFRAVFAGVARSHPAVLFDPFFLEGVAADPALNQADGIHPDARGVAIIVARLLPMVERLLAMVPRA